MDKNVAAVDTSRAAAHGGGHGAGDDDDASCLYAQELVYAYNVSMTVKAAIELGLLDELSAAAGRALTAGELVASPMFNQAKDKDEAAAMVDRILRYLASFKVVKCSTETGPDGKVLWRYTPAPPCRWLTKNNNEGSLAPMAMMAVDHQNFPSWHQIAAAVTEGGMTPFEKAHGAPIYEYMGRNQRLSTLFDQAMEQQSVLVINKLLEHSQVFDGIDMLVDVGGGTGATIAMITNQYKNIRGINFDLPHVISQAPSLPGVEHVAGSWFESIPRGDAMFMKWILHMQNDEDCIKILKTCHRALPDNGKVIVMNSILPEFPDTTPAARDSHTMDMIMLVNFKGGKERTEKEYAKLARDAGFLGTFVATYIFCNIYALEFTK